MAEVKKTVKKTAAPKAAPQAVKKVVEKKEAAPKAAKPAVKEEKVEATVAAPKKVAGLKVEVVDATGKVVETMELPKEVFGAKINSTLMAQAVRVYLANQRLGTASTKTRGEVDGSTRKIYRQKGTGRARHGGVRAPIFVKGGVSHGPKPVDHSRSLPKNMKRAALVSALTVKLQNNEIKVVTGFEKVEMKTKAVADALKDLGLTRTKALIVMPKHDEKLYKAGRNIKTVSLTAASQLNTYAILNTKTLVLMKESIEEMKKTFTKEK